jgi:hypothetical protein
MNHKDRMLRYGLHSACSVEEPVYCSCEFGKGFLVPIKFGNYLCKLVTGAFIRKAQSEGVDHLVMPLNIEL